MAGAVGSVDVSAPRVAVLVTGTWSPPEDWCFVVQRLRSRRIDAIAVGLPSNRLADATRADDIAETRAAIKQAQGPVVVVGWSYGGNVISDAAVGEGNVVRLIYVATLPRPAHPVAGEEPPALPPDLSHLLFPNEKTFVLDDQWWLTDGDGATLPEHVIAHLWAHRRRPMSLAAVLGSQHDDAWRTIPTTVLLGRNDDGNPTECQDWARAHFDDVRIIDSDHFIPFRHPDVVADLIEQALRPAPA